MSNERLAKLIEKGGEDGCLKFFHGMSEKDRRELFPQAKAAWIVARRNTMIETSPGSYSFNPSLAAASTAYFATATGSEIKQAKRSGRPSWVAMEQILLDRRPDWVDGWIAEILEESYYWGHWTMIRRLMKAGLAKRPDSPKYYLGMILALAGRWHKKPIVKSLLESPDLLEHEVWKLFEYDGEGENSLANTERFDRSWHQAFLELIKQGKLPRKRMLECTLEALERDFNHYRARWFFEFYDKLSPSEKEEQAHSDRYLGLLRATAPNVAAWALERVTRLTKAGRYSSESLAHSLAPILQARPKAPVLEGLKLLEFQAAADPAQASRIAQTACIALKHEKPDVQAAALVLIERLAAPTDAEVRAAVQEAADGMAASVRKRAAQWLDDAGKPAGAAARTPGKSTKQDAKPAAAKLPKIPAALRALYALDTLEANRKQGVLAIPAARFDGTDIPRLPFVAPVAPIENIEELIDVAARVTEDPTRVDDAERALAAMSRLCGSKSADFDRLAGPLLKRIVALVRKSANPFCGVGPADDMMGVFHAFCTGQAIDPKYDVASSERRWDSFKFVYYQFEGGQHESYSLNMHKPLGFLARRSLELARRVARGEAGELLSEPTHEGGWIDPLALARRVNARKDAAPDAYDVILAMLRLAPESRAKALKSLKSDAKAEWRQAIRYALGDDAKPGKDGPLWVAATRARAPWSDDARVAKAFPDLGPDAGIAAKLVFSWSKRGKFTRPCFGVEPKPPKKPDPRLATVLFHSARNLDDGLTFEMGGLTGRTNGAVRWTSTVWPGARDSYFVDSAQDCFANIDWWEANWQNRTTLEPLLDAGTPLRHAGLLFLTGMLAAKEPGESGLATDAAIQAIADGRLGSDNLGDALAELMALGLFLPGRWQKTLGEAAQASRVHAAVVQLALQQCFRAVKDPPKDAAKLLELLHELSLEWNLTVGDKAFRQRLSAGWTGKAGVLAKKLLALQATDETAGSIAETLDLAVEQRTLAASRALD